MIFLPKKSNFYVSSLLILKEAKTVLNLINIRLLAFFILKKKESLHIEIKFEDCLFSIQKITFIFCFFIKTEKKMLKSYRFLHLLLCC
jgi:hypothetical protein